MAYSYEHPRPVLTVDCVVFGRDTDELKIVLIQSRYKPQYDLEQIMGRESRDPPLDQLPKKASMSMDSFLPDTTASTAR